MSNHWVNDISLLLLVNLFAEKKTLEINNSREKSCPVARVFLQSIMMTQTK